MPGADDSSNAASAAGESVASAERTVGYTVSTLSKRLIENISATTGCSAAIAIGRFWARIDFAAIIDATRQSQTLQNGLIVEQEAFTVDPFESLAVSCRYLRSLLHE